MDNFTIAAPNNNILCGLDCGFGHYKLSYDDKNVRQDKQNQRDGFHGYLQKKRPLPR